MNRYIRIDLEVDSELCYSAISSIKQILNEDMPYLKLLSARSAPGLRDLDKFSGYVLPTDNK